MYSTGVTHLIYTNSTGVTPTAPVSHQQHRCYTRSPVLHQQQHRCYTGPKEVLSTCTHDRNQGHRFSYIMANGIDHPAKNHLISRIDTSHNGIHVHGSSHYDQIGSKWHTNMAGHTHCIYLSWRVYNTFINLSSSFVMRNSIAALQFNAVC